MMPSIALGTFKSDEGDVGKAVATAISEVGYRHIDGAAAYLNEHSIGDTLKQVR